MKSIAVPRQVDSLNDLLKQASREEILLEATDGRRFILASVEKWKSFHVGDDDDITENRDLMTHLSNRRGEGRRVPLTDVKEILGL
uniref:Antitoxin Phd_YefM, type II toxin-antitoxin system n=1 Tax=Candidatus Kentrum sp. LPFa TaxID=2126335 RepID=A0A450Y0A7_9GAMM|nr:MAG: hypothetical protein BECKLPF1236A_GA0070988_103054 [Candidatus Kentron sp. LPFa]VFK34960.1 MAG: hypothetical protein BECKLPF1236C_GA0070990_103174 [Candidatus Kentron sp. LPFa]